jgi:superfamily II DNA or RNA helicase
MIQLRSYQTECLQAITSLIAQAIKADPSTRALVLAFSTDLLRQARDKLQMIAPGLTIGILDASSKEFDSQVIVSSIQSARQASNLERLQAQGFSICIADECHHFASDTARFVLNELGFGCTTSNRLLVGFSATPFRSDGKGLGEIFDKIVYSRSIKQMVNDGYLCKPLGHKVLTDLDLSQIAIENGDYSPTALSKLMNTEAINQTIVNSYLEKAAGRKTIAFATSIELSIALAECFQRFGIFAEAIHSNLPSMEREAIKNRFQNGDIEVLTNPLMLTEGYDEPSISSVIIARPTKVVGLYQQMAGRGLRLFPNKKDCVILDFGDQMHSLVGIEAMLGYDIDESSEKRQKNAKVEEIARTLPSSINPKLKKAILEIDLLGESFTWQKDFDGCYYLKGAGDALLKLIKHGEGRYDAILSGSKGVKTIASGLDFAYSFSAAEDYVKSNRALFAVSDLNAPWRSLPISEKQKELFRSVGFKSGIDDLSRGQAATIISSGILRRKKQSSRRK